ncbi:17632_t:CDS:2 [Entrophospora sp. SA101]|nr:17632_t:CDS:2 [Entrophospora sp. SA101]
MLRDTINKESELNQDLKKNVLNGLREEKLLPKNLNAIVVKNILSTIISFAQFVISQNVIRVKYRGRKERQAWFKKQV